MEQDFISAVAAYFDAWNGKLGTNIVNRRADAIALVVDTWQKEGNAIECLQRLLENATPEVRLSAANSLVRLGVYEQVIPVLRALEKDGEGRTSLDAKLALMVLAKRQESARTSRTTSESGDSDA